MKTKVMLTMLVVLAVMVGPSYSQLLRRLIGLRRVPFAGQRPGFAGQQPGFAAQQPGFAPGFGNANAAGLGNGAVQNGQAIGTGTGIANVGPGGFGIGLGIGAAVATPLGNFAVGDGQSVSLGK